jgi:hypothetical protein
MLVVLKTEAVKSSYRTKNDILFSVCLVELKVKIVS